MNFAELKLFFINLFTVPDLKPGLEGAHHTAYKNMLLGTATKKYLHEKNCTENWEHQISVNTGHTDDA